MEVFLVDPKCMPDYELEIPAGTLAVIPAVDWSEHSRMRDGAYANGLLHEFEEANQGLLPQGTVVCIGQVLKREWYPELSAIYAETGNFYEFQLPNLTKRFIISVDLETNEIQWGDGVIYYESLPKKDSPPSRDVKRL